MPKENKAWTELYWEALQKLRVIRGVQYEFVFHTEKLDLDIFTLFWHIGVKTNT